MKLKTDNRPQITVVGGAHIDIFIKTQFPPGFEGSITSGSTQVFPGGKAACIAAALARLRCRVFYVSCVGTDPSSAILINQLQQQNVNLDFVERSRSLPTGMVHHIESRKGALQRIYSPGASISLSRDAISKASVMFSVSDMVIITPDIPPDTMSFAAALAHRFRAPVLLDPDPYDVFTGREDLSDFDIIAPEQMAAEALCGWSIKTTGDASRCAARLIARGAGAAVLSLGERGLIASASLKSASYIPLPEGSAMHSPYSKSAMDAGIAWGLALGYTLPEAAWIGVSCALSIKPDAQEPFSSFPGLDDLVEAQSVDFE